MYNAGPAEPRNVFNSQDETALQSKIILAKQFGAVLVIESDWLHSTDHRRVRIA